MKPSTAHKLRLTCFLSALIFGLRLLSACGTEIGNGRKQTDSSKASNGITNSSAGGSENAPPASPASSADPESSAADGGNVPDKDEGLPDGEESSAFEYLLIKCGSPIVDMKPSIFRDNVSQATLTVTVPSMNTWTIRLSAPAVLATVQADSRSPSNPYAISGSSAFVVTKDCLESSSEVSNGITVRTVKYADSFQTKWVLDANGNVTGIKVLNPQGTVVHTFDPE